mgnify:CR=1 FL=1
MAIITTTNEGAVTTQFSGRVIEVRTFQATRNMSDTLDYSDYRVVTCTEALVWLGTHGMPALYTEPRDLEFHEQFRWIDVSNHFAWRNNEVRTAEVDAVMGVNGDPLMWANLIAWRNHLENVAAIRRREEEERKEAARAAAKAKAEKEAVRAAKDEAAKASAEREQLAKMPPKGTSVRTKGGLVGKVFWTGTKKYRGTWNVRLGVKDSRGTVEWCGVDDVTRI